MQNLDDLTVLILTYRTPEKIILDCLKSLDKNIKILIVENSNDFTHKNIIKHEFPNVKIICTGDNLGYAEGNNFGLKYVKTDYVLILNPDVICEKIFFSNILDVVKEAKDFTIIGCQYLFDKVFMPAGFFERKKDIIFKEKFKKDEIESLEKVEWVTGCSMLINLKQFNKKEIFDQNYFLYFEEFDLCKSLVRDNKKIFTSKKLKVHHLGFKSSISDDPQKNSRTINIKDWHYMWSSFYYYKKNYSYIYALNKLIGKLFRSLIKLIFYSINFKKNKRDKYLFRFLGLLKSILCKPSDYRG